MKWINVENEFPLIDETVLMYTPLNDDKYMTGFWTGTYWCDNSFVNIQQFPTHWCRLTAPQTIDEIETEAYLNRFQESKTT